MSTDQAVYSGIHVGWDLKGQSEVLLLGRHRTDFTFSIAGYGLCLQHTVSFNNWLWPMVCGTLCPSRLFPKSYHYECVHQLGGNFSMACFSYTQILLLLGFTGGYVSLTFSLSLVLLANVSFTCLLFPKLHFCFL